MEESRFDVEFIDSKAEEHFLFLPKSAQKIIRTAIEERLEVDPIKFGKPLKHSYRGYRSLRVSIYRIIYKIELERRTVVISVIDYRRDSYK